ncbi:hypothetical protein N480_04990 [Pseudoalteromonas luteoviolacea S2607]|nr:hypothetical protein N480_04990 [Pseudoalteromonas luteoviolacea S2607]
MEFDAGYNAMWAFRPDNEDWPRLIKVIGLVFPYVEQ